MIPEEFAVHKARLAKTDILILYTDGVSEATDPSGIEYGTERLARFAADHYHLPPSDLIHACIEDLEAFRSEAPQADDLTIMAIQLSGESPQ